jgi:hypothetical protein
MAMKLNRSYNQEVSAYEDRVMLHMIKGDSGVIPGIYDAFEAVADSAAKTVTVKSGMGLMYGHQFILPSGETKVLDLSLFSSPDDCTTIFVEIDCRDLYNEIVDIKAISQKYSYPVISSADLITTPQGIARYELYYAWFENGVLILEQAFVPLENDTVNNSKFINRNKITYDPAKDALTITPTGAKTGYLERKFLIYSGDSHKELYANNTIELLEALAEGDMWEVHWSLGPGVSVGGVMNYESPRITRGQGSVVKISGTKGGDIAIVNTNVRFRLFDYSFSHDSSGTSKTWKMGTPLVYLLYDFTSSGGVLSWEKASGTPGIVISKIYKILGGNV